MNCRKARTYIARNMGEDLTTMISVEVDAHIKDCKECNSYFEFVRTAFLDLDNTDNVIPASPYFYSRLIQKMENRNEGIKSWFALKSFQSIAAAVVFFVAIALGFFIGNSNSILYNSNDSYLEVSEEEYISYFQTELFEEQYLNIIEDEQ